ncbi:MAG: hypothetical protein RLZZ308_302 [Candidatus Parcubacteria bacterium]|jgi:hypothetical protein
MKIVSIFKHLFIPHEHNEYKPHFFREVSMALVLLVSVFMLGLSAGSSFFIHRTVLGATIATSVLVDLANESRLAYNQPVLTRNPTLDAAATLKATDMVTEGYFAHDSPKGLTPWHWLSLVGYNFLYAGENLAVNFSESRDVQKAWMDSPTHKANLLNGHFKEIGMAAMEGSHKGNKSIFIVQMFGTPAQIKQAVQVEESNQVSTTTEKIATTTRITTTSSSSTGSSVEIKDQRLSHVENEKETQETQQYLESASSTLPEVRGETVEPVRDQSQLLEPLVTTTNFSAVKNMLAEDDASSTAVLSEEATQGSVHAKTLYSRWYERLVFFATNYIGVLYKLLLGLVAMAFVTMLLIEFKKQHYRHMVYGVLMMCALMLLIYINSTFL